jgi:hypothetical protein
VRSEEYQTIRRSVCVVCGGAGVDDISGSEEDDLSGDEDSGEEGGAGSDSGEEEAAAEESDSEDDEADPSVGGGGGGPAVPTVIDPFFMEGALPFQQRGEECRKNVPVHKPPGP